MPLKRLLTVATSISAVVVAGMLAAGAVSGISNDTHKAGSYSPFDPASSGPISSQGGADLLPLNNGKIGGSSTPAPQAGSGLTSPTGSHATNSSRTTPSGAKPIATGSGATSNGGATQADPETGSVAPSTSSTSFDDDVDDSGPDDPLIDD